MTKLVPVTIALSALAATAMGLDSPAFSQQVECYQSWVPAIQNCHTVSNNLGYGAWDYATRHHRPARIEMNGRQFAPAYGPPQSPGIGPNGDARYGLYNEAPGGS
jgi:hypothetical protein